MNLYHRLIRTQTTLAKTEILYPQKCEGKSSHGFHIKWIIGTHGNWKNQNPGSCFGAEYLSYVKFIPTYALTFFGYIILVLASAHC
jgi:hypothetical protein